MKYFLLIGENLAILDLLGVSKSYESQQILNEIDFFINKGERICIIGKNGGGKSTLMKIINGTLEFDEGRRIVQNGIKVEMLSQSPSFSKDISVKDAIEEELSELKSAKIEYDKLSKQLENDFNNKELLKRHEELTNYLDLHSAWNLDDKIERVLLQFGLKSLENRLVTLLSGGEQRRVTLAGLILKKPDILLLDEPTNHLDVYMVEFLEEMLLKEKFTLVFISHDRYFIDNIATKTIEIDNCKLRTFNGGYEKYLIEKGVSEEMINKLDLFGISSIANIIGCIKMAKYYEMDSSKVLFTVATDSMEMYKSRVKEELEDRGEFSHEEAAVVYNRDLMGIGIDNMMEMTYYDKKRMHNLKYFTWIEQQGKTVEELDAQWYDDNYWKDQFGKVNEWDEKITEFNRKTGLLKKYE